MTPVSLLRFRSGCWGDLRRQDALQTEAEKSIKKVWVFVAARGDDYPYGYPGHGPGVSPSQLWRCSHVVKTRCLPQAQYMLNMSVKIWCSNREMSDEFAEQNPWPAAKQAPETM